MNPVTGEPGTLAELIALLNGGGSAAMIAVLWVAFSVKKKLEAYFDGVNRALDRHGKRITRIERHNNLPPLGSEDEIY